MACPDRAPRLIHVHGSAGIGKTSLVRKLARELESLGRGVSRLDGRIAPWSADRIERSLQGRVDIVVVDSFERFELLEGWFRERALMDLPSRVRVVLAGRRPLCDRWTLDPGWRPHVVQLELGPLQDEEVERFLAARRVSEARWRELAARSGGHPGRLAFLVQGLEDPTATPRCSEWIEAVESRRAEPTVVVERAALLDYVRKALRDFHRGDRLAASPLLALLGCDSVASLREQIAHACRSLGEHGGDAVHARVLETTYLGEPQKQLAAAAELGMSYASYRRRLREATDRLVDGWSHELRAEAPG